jgi:penicillin amidase
VDLVVLDVHPQDPQHYRTADGWQAFLEHEEVVQIHGAPARTQVVRSTIWGPVIDSDAQGRQRALRWLAHAPQATNLGLLRMETARDLEQAMQVAHTSGIPPQNLILADSDGNIAWTIMGKIPRRRGYDGRLPGSWADAGRDWLGWLPPADYPRVVNPASGAVWSANARVANGEALRAIGDGGYALGARATQIRDSLLALEEASEADMLAIQLDDRALFLARWRELLLQALAADAPRGNARRAELRRVLQGSAQRAAVDDAGYRLLRAFRRELAGRVFAGIVDACSGLDAGAIGSPPRQWEGAVWRILEERPPHLLDPRYASWEALVLAAADAAIQECPAGDLARCTWGKANVVTIRHPLSAALPWLARWLDMPAESLPGDTHMPRVQGPSMGASQRFAVTPGDESSGYFHMPGGQSGHPLSPFYTAGHRAWAEGRTTPFLPGTDEHLLRLLPAR